MTTGISGVKSREDLVMSNTDLSATATAADPFSAAPFKPPAGMVIIIIIIKNVLIRVRILNPGRGIFPRGILSCQGKFHFDGKLKGDSEPDNLVLTSHC